jgi:flagellar biosynthesis protein FliQ
MIREDSSLLSTTYVGVLIIGITKAVMLISERLLVWKPHLILQPSQISIFENIFLQLSFFKVSKLTGD